MNSVEEGLLDIGVQKVSRGATMADTVVEIVRTAIMSGEMSPEAWYSTIQLANDLGFSRSPVREGLLRLEEAGAIEFVRNKGFRVNPITPADIVEIFAMRVALEVPAVWRAARHFENSTEELDRVRSDMSSAAAEGDEDKFGQADVDLHTALLRIGGANRALEVVSRLRATTRLLGVSSSRSEKSMKEVHQDHEAIVNAVVDGDCDEASRLMREHLISTGQIITKKLMSETADNRDSEELWARMTEGYLIHDGLQMEH